MLHTSAMQMMQQTCSQAKAEKVSRAACRLDGCCWSWEDCNLHEVTFRSVIRHLSLARNGGKMERNWGNQETWGRGLWESGQ